MYLTFGFSIAGYCFHYDSSTSDREPTHFCRYQDSYGNLHWKGSMAKEVIGIEETWIAGGWTVRKHTETEAGKKWQKEMDSRLKSEEDEEVESE